MRRTRFRRSLKRIPWKAIRKANRRRPPSSLEMTVEAWLKEDGIPFRKEFAISQCHVDVLIGETAVELNGCYWHGCPRCHPEKSRKLESKRRRDRRRMTFLRNQGYDILVLWECDVKKNPEIAREKLRSLARSA